MGRVTSEATCEKVFWPNNIIIRDQRMKTGTSSEKVKMITAYFP
jgi:tetrahydromethanopterin S-methyltransferase subunit F